MKTLARSSTSTRRSSSSNETSNASSVVGSVTGSSPPRSQHGPGRLLDEQLSAVRELLDAVTDDTEHRRTRLLRELRGQPLRDRVQYNVHGRPPETPQLRRPLSDAMPAAHADHAPESGTLCPCSTALYRLELSRGVRRGVSAASR